MANPRKSSLFNIPHQLDTVRCFISFGVGQLSGGLQRGVPAGSGAFGRTPFCKGTSRKSQTAGFPLVFSFDTIQPRVPDRTYQGHFKEKRKKKRHLRVRAASSPGFSFRKSRIPGPGLLRASQPGSRAPSSLSPGSRAEVSCQSYGRGFHVSTASSWEGQAHCQGK